MTMRTVVDAVTTDGSATINVNDARSPPPAPIYGRGSRPSTAGVVVIRVTWARETGNRMTSRADEMSAAASQASGARPLISC